MGIIATTNVVAWWSRRPLAQPTASGNLGKDPCRQPAIHSGNAGDLGVHTLAEQPPLSDALQRVLGVGVRRQMGEDGLVRFVPMCEWLTGNSQAGGVPY
jgi:hypothetical protein